VPVCVSACPRAAGMDVNATTVPTTGSQSCITPDASGTCSG
jgi:hypothetical protein